MEILTLCFEMQKKTGECNHKSFKIQTWIFFKSGNFITSTLDFVILTCTASTKLGQESPLKQSKQGNVTLIKAALTTDLFLIKQRRAIKTTYLHNENANIYLTKF